MGTATHDIDQVIRDLMFIEDDLDTLAPTISERVRDFIPAILSCEVGHAVTSTDWDELVLCRDRYDKSEPASTQARYWAERQDAARAAIIRPARQVAA